MIPQIHRTERIGASKVTEAGDRRPEVFGQWSVVGRQLFVG